MKKKKKKLLLGPVITIIILTISIMIISAICSALGVQGEVCTEVAQHTGKGLHIHAAGDGHGRECVPKLVEAVLASGENNHSRSIENNQFQSNKNNQSKIRKRSQPSLGM